MVNQLFLFEALTRFDTVFPHYTKRNLQRSDDLLVKTRKVCQKLTGTSNKKNWATTNSIPLGISFSFVRFCLRIKLERAQIQKTFEIEKIQLVPAKNVYQDEKNRKSAKRIGYATQLANIDMGNDFQYL